MKKLNNVSRVRFNDYSEYESGKSNNGGCYGFWTEYNRIENGLWEVSYGTTADFEYCPVCGQFTSHYAGDDAGTESGYTCGEFETITSLELLDLINNFKEAEDYWVEYK